MIDHSFLQLMFLLLTAGSVNGADWVEIVQPVEYFKSRKIVPTIDLLIDVVIEDVKTPKAQIKQLMALRHLTDESDKFKKAPNYDTNRLAIEEIAAGKRGKDATGFGQEYAKRLLAKLDGTKLTAAKPRPLRLDALNWFPADTKLAMAFDMHEMQDVFKDSRKELVKTFSETARLKLLNALERMGNIRLERVAIGIIDAEKPGNQKSFIRISGKANPAWLMEMAEETGGIAQSKKTKDADGTAIITLQMNGGPCVLFIGNTDVVILSNQQFDGNYEAPIADLFAVRAKKNPHAAEGKLKDRLAKIPDKAVGFLIGDLPGDLKAELSQVMDPLPAKISAYLEQAPMGLAVKTEVEMKDAAEAGKFLAKFAVLRKEGIAGLQEALKNPPEPGLPLVPYQSIIKLVDTIQMQTQGKTVRGSAFVSSLLIQQIGEMYAASIDPLMKE